MAAATVAAGPAGDAPPGRPGWWRTGWMLVLASVFSTLVWIVAIVALNPVTGLWAGVNGTEAREPFLVVGPLSALAAAGLFAFGLSILAVPTSWVADAWLDPAPALTWVVLALGVSGSGAFFGGLLGWSGFGGLVAAIAILRYGAYDARGTARPGLLDVVPAHRRRHVARLVVATPVVGLLAAAAYHAAHPVYANDWDRSFSGSTGTPRFAVRSHRYADPPLVRVTLPAAASALGAVTLLGARFAGDDADRTRVIRIGSTAEQVRRRIPPTLAPVTLRTGGLELWFTAPRCPAPPLELDRLDVRVRNWTGTRWVPLRTATALRVPCVMPRR